MNVFKIAWRSIQHRGLGSWLTVLSMALGVMMVVAVLSIHGIVSKSFKNNNSFGYNMIVGARGGGMQLTLNTVYYLSQPVENVPYEYYLAFCDRETRQREMQYSFATAANESESQSMDLLNSFDAPGAAGLIGNAIMQDVYAAQQTNYMSVNEDGLYHTYTHIAIPLCLGDYWEPTPGAGLNFRCVGTKPGFFDKLLIDIDTPVNNKIDCTNCSNRFEGQLTDATKCPRCGIGKDNLRVARGRKFEFAAGRNFETLSAENGYFECVLGAVAADRAGAKIGDLIRPTHGDPSKSNAHIHEDNPFKVVGILAKTGTPHDRVVFLNMEGFFLIEDHIKPIEDDSLLGRSDDSDDDSSTPLDVSAIDPFEMEASQQASQATGEPGSLDTGDYQADDADDQPVTPDQLAANKDLSRIPLPIEQREVTAILVRTSLEDEYGLLAMMLPPQIGQGDLETTLGWSAFRPVKSQKAAQAVNPVEQVSSLFSLFVDPIRWLLLALTIMICFVSAISILVGIYNSMSQRQHEIAVIRALGASRSKVMSIMLIEAILLAFMGGMLGWVAGHSLNVALNPLIEARTGVGIGFFDVAPGMPIFAYLFSGNSIIPEWVLQLSVSPELLLIPGLMVLAVIVGIYPAVSAYKTDVSTSLGK